MYIYTLLSISALAFVVEGRGLWDILEDIFSSPVKQPEDSRLNIKELAHKYGYAIHEHTVTTEDGYILNFHRISSQQDVEKNNGSKPAVFLMHGILDSSDSWLLLGPNLSLAYTLVDQGYDVWMGNARGNKHSIEHAFLNNTTAEYWQFSWEEIGLYDLPAMIDFILKKTKRDSLYYIGHSQGTTNALVLLSMKPEYNKKIKAMFLLAPEAWMANVKSPLLRLFSPAADLLGTLLFDFGSYSVGSHFFNKTSSYLCSWLPLSCDNILYSMSGNTNKVSATLLQVIFGHMPTGSSTLQFVHYGQLVNSERFCRFDHGLQKNRQIYGQDTPPDYDVSKVVAPSVLYYGGKDWLSDPSDVDKLKSKLPNVMSYIYLSDFNHMDYLYAVEAFESVYSRIRAQISKFELNNELNIVPN